MQQKQWLTAAWNAISKMQNAAKSNRLLNHTKGSYCNSKSSNCNSKTSDCSSESSNHNSKCSNYNSNSK